MRPSSIVMFERLFLASLAVGALTFVIGYESITAVLASDPRFQKAGVGGGFVIGLVAALYAFCLLLWYLIAHRASNAAKWILVVLVVLDVLSVLPALTGPFDGMLLLTFAIRVLEIAAVVYLFRADAVAWLTDEGAADATADPIADPAVPD